MTLRPPVKWYGGKRYLAPLIVKQFPPHRIYLEPFGGGASVLLNKAPVDVETYNDLDLRISRLFQVLRDRSEEFIQKASLTLYSQVEFEAAMSDSTDGSDVESALRDFIRWRQSFAGKGQSWSCATTRARGGMAGDVNAWWSSIEMLPELVDRIRRVQILCQSAFDAIPKFDHEEALIYCDPPYVHSTRGKQSRRVYHGEMNDGEHARLADMLNGCKAKIVVSGYRSGLYDDLYSGWRRMDFDIANHAAGGKSKARATESLWMNFG